MHKRTRMLICVAAIAVVALVIWLWVGYPIRHDESVTAANPGADAGGPAVGSVATKAPDGSGKPSEVQQMPSPAGGRTRIASSTPGSIAPALPDRDLVEANRAQLLSAQQEIRSFLKELETGNVAGAESRTKLANWAEVLYRDALLAELTDGAPAVERQDELRGELASQQLRVDSSTIPGELPTTEERYGVYLRQLLAEIVAEQESMTKSIALDLTLRVDDLLQRRKRHSDNLFLPEIRVYVLDSGLPVNDRIAYVEQFRSAGDAALARYGAKLLADVPSRETLSSEERSAISRFQADAAKETAQ